jgi:predicted phosphate transport protein (TIGR00153 family)
MLALLRRFGPRRRVYLSGLLDHYAPVAKSLNVLDEAFGRYRRKSADRGYQMLAAQIDVLEGEADRIKRRVRNHLPPAMLMVADKTLFLAYTRHQDNILDAAQEALTWLGLGEPDLPADVVDLFEQYQARVKKTVRRLKPALAETITFLLHDVPDRASLKRRYHEVRVRHQKSARVRRDLLTSLFALPADFRDVYPLVRYMERLEQMSHEAEACADTLRAMIAR